MIYTYNAGARKRKTTETALKLHIKDRINKTYCRQGITGTWIESPEQTGARVCKSCLHNMNQAKLKGLV